MVFQDPASSLNPRLSVREIIAEPLVLNQVLRGKKGIDERVGHLMEMVGLNPQHLTRYPHAFSGGQRQRIGIARALALDPTLIVADEPTSALDVSVQAQILNLLLDIQQTMGIAYIFVTHDLRLVQHVSDKLAVMYLGQIVEFGATADVFRNPMHPYTKALLAAIPSSAPGQSAPPIEIKGEIADPKNRPPGCPFHPRCPYAEPVCETTVPTLEAVADGGRTVSCHLIE